MVRLLESDFGEPIAPHLSAGCRTVSMIRAGDDEKSKGLAVGFLNEIGRYASVGLAAYIFASGGDGDGAA